MKTIIIDENTEEGRELLEIIRTMKRSGNPAIAGIWDHDPDNSVNEPQAPYWTSRDECLDEEDEELDNIPFSPIPGLAYTHEERIAELQRILDEHDPEKCITLEELDKDMESW